MPYLGHLNDLRELVLETTYYTIYCQVETVLRVGKGCQSLEEGFQEWCCLSDEHAYLSNWIFTRLSKRNKNVRTMVI